MLAFFLCVPNLKKKSKGKGNEHKITLIDTKNERITWKLDDKISNE